MAPENIQQEAEQGKKENLKSGRIMQESLKIFHIQQQVAHDNGLRTTSQLHWRPVFFFGTFAQS